MYKHIYMDLSSYIILYGSFIVYYISSIYVLSQWFESICTNNTILNVVLLYSTWVVT